MTRRSMIAATTCLLLLALTLSAVATAHADSRVQRYVIAGGGGESGGGNFRLHGTIGQPAVGLLSGGGFRLQGGFWYGQAAPALLYSLYLPLLLKQ